MKVKKQQLEMDIEQTGSKSGKEYVKAVYCHSAYLTSVHSTSCKMPVWIKHKLESRLLGEISITSDTQKIPPLWQKTKKNYKGPLMKGKEETEKVGLKLNIQKTKFMACGPVTSRQIDRETRESVIDFIWGAPKSLQMVTAAVKLKDACSLKEKQ